jgi:hypothetical protein
MIKYLLIFLLVMLLLLKAAGFIFWIWWSFMIPALIIGCIVGLIIYSFKH